jgi:hypothetical protein
MTGSALRSVPSDRSTGACGAWSDIVPRPHGDLALTVGDVAGHGLEARRLRDLLHRAQHGLTVAGLSPEQILTGLRDLINGTDGALATAACVALAPDGCPSSWPTPVTHRRCSSAATARSRSSSPM